MTDYFLLCSNGNHGNQDIAPEEGEARQKRENTKEDVVLARENEETRGSDGSLEVDFDQAGEYENAGETEGTPEEKDQKTRRSRNLFCFPAMSNYNGFKFDLSWIRRIQESGEDGENLVLLDTACFLSTNTLGNLKFLLCGIFTEHNSSEIRVIWPNAHGSTHIFRKSFLVKPRAQNSTNENIESEYE